MGVSTLIVGQVNRHDEIFFQQRAFLRLQNISGPCLRTSRETHRCSCLSRQKTRPNQAMIAFAPKCATWYLRRDNPISNRKAAYVNRETGGDAGILNDKLHPSPPSCVRQSPAVCSRTRLFFFVEMEMEKFPRVGRIFRAHLKRGLKPSQRTHRTQPKSNDGPKERERT